MSETTQELERDLGLYAVFAVATGAMIGSGIFILPGLAMAESGPAVILAFAIAGVLVLPAAVSIAELGTAMPEAGGDYIFIERGLGPGAGTIAGLGTWLMLMFKGALALVGGMFYVEAVRALPTYTVELPGVLHPIAATVMLPGVEILAITIGVILIAVNLIGVKQTGGLQLIMVAVMLLIMAGFVVLTIGSVEGEQYGGFFAEGTTGLLSGTAMVLISYGGVTKVAAVAEEIENPGRNLPLGLLASLLFTTALYALIVFVLVGVVDAEALAGSETPMVDAVEPFYGFAAVVLIVLAAMLALISTANAGILTASRYPFALSRDRLLPAFFGSVNQRLHTPVVAILITGGAMLVIILLLPVEEIAKTAGAFQIIVYILVNVALIAFRIRNPVWYEPDFVAPAYPWVQLFGVASGIGILTQMDTLPLVGGVGFVILGTIWYLVYGRERVDREGVIGEAVAETIEPAAGEDKPYRIVVPIANAETQRQWIWLAAAIASDREEAEIIPVNVVTVPEQTSLAQDVEFEAERIERQNELLAVAEEAAAELEVGVRTHAMVARDVSDAILHVIEDEHADLALIGWHGGRRHPRFAIGSIIDPIVERAPCEVVLAKGGTNRVGRAVTFVGAGPYSPVAIRRAWSLVNSEPEATLSLVHIADPEDEHGTRAGMETIEEAASAAGLEPDAYEAEVVAGTDVEETMIAVAAEYDTVSIGASRTTHIEQALFGSLPESVGERVSGTVLIVRGEEGAPRSIRLALLRRLRGW